MARHVILKLLEIQLPNCYSTWMCSPQARGIVDGCGGLGRAVTMLNFLSTSLPHQTYQYLWSQHVCVCAGEYVCKLLYSCIVIKNLNSQLDLSVVG